MFAVIKTGGKQYRVQEGDVLFVEKLDLDEGKKVTFDHVLLIEQGKDTLIGTPVVEKAQVIGEVVENFKDKKILVFKKKRRKQYRKTAGHRQMLTRIKIEKILTEGKAPVEKKSPKKKMKPEEELKKLEAEVVKKKPAAKKEEIKAAKPEKPEQKAESEKSDAKKAEPKKPKPKEPERKSQKSTPAVKKKSAAKPPSKPSAKPAAKKTATKAKKSTTKKEK